jgi:hypothetical protein
MLPFLAATLTPVNGGGLSVIRLPRRSFMILFKLNALAEFGDSMDILPTIFFLLLSMKKRLTRTVPPDQGNNNTLPNLHLALAPFWDRGLVALLGSASSAPRSSCSG